MKSTIKTLLALLPIVGTTACSETEDIVFESELPQFEIRDNAILLEVIPPIGTSSDDNIYIVGDFNGGAEQAIGNVLWQCEKASGADKWGIYILPTDFRNGKTLSDGFYFVSEKEGIERTITNGDALHTLNVGAGTRTNVTIARWESYFSTKEDNNEPTIVHDGYVVYVLDETSWGGALSVYMWGDVNDLNGGWPGMAPTGTETIDGVLYTYFDMGEANSGLVENLIFNNNGGGSQLADYAFTIDHNIFLRISDSGVTTIDNNATDNTADETIDESDTTDSEDNSSEDNASSADVEHDGYVVYVLDETSWGGALSVYMWGDVNDLNGGWPGMAPTGTETIDGVLYTYFDMGEANSGLVENLIFNNNGGGSQLADYAFTIDHNIFLRITNEGVETLDVDIEEE